jgi:hypothetical protein
MRTRLLCAAVVATALVSTAPAFAQTPSSEWQVTLSPYLMGASMNGTTTLKGQEAVTDVSASQIFSNLQFGAMGFVVARKGNWGVGGDALWMALGATTDKPSGAVDVNQGGFAFYGLRRLGAAADLTFGARVNLLQGKVRFDGPLKLSVDQDKTWVDPLVGIIIRTPGERRLGFRVYGEIGGFGIGSKVEWQIWPTASIRLSDKAALDLGYRWLSMNYEDGEGLEKFGYDVLTQGPVAGFVFRF